ncbi:hypothetical protein HDV02_005474 [Globomyces sp. JEL0801]|nr:hypothetical protein HDV02_005474 [Globomyces sp. JEL0801]
MQFSAIFLLALASVVQADKPATSKKCKTKNTPPVPKQVLQTVPCNRAAGDYAPRTTIKAAFKSSDASKGVTADVKINTKIAALNVENFPQIKNIECAADKVKVTFDKVENAAAAIAAWNTHKDLALIFGHERNCNGNNALATRGVSNITQNDKVLSIDTTALPQDQVIEDYVLDLTQGSVQPVQKRGLLDFDKSLSYPLNVNYRNNAITNNKISIVQNPFVSVYCKDCHTRGQATLRAVVHASWFQVKAYEFSISGDFNANLDLELNIHKRNDKIIFKKSLLPVGLNVGVPGFFEFSPKFDVEAGVSYSVNEPVVASYGYDLAFPFNYKLHSYDGLFAKPVFTKQGSPVLREHALTRSKDILIESSAHLIPSFNLGLKLFKLKAFELSLAMNNELKFRFATDKHTFCPQDKVNIVMFRRHDVSFSLSTGRYWLLYDSGDISLICFFCNVCFPNPNPSITTTTTFGKTTTTNVIAPTTTTVAKTTTTVAPTTTTVAPTTTTVAQTTTAVAQTTTTKGGEASTTTTNGAIAVTTSTNGAGSATSTSTATATNGADSTATNTSASTKATATATNATDSTTTTNGAGSATSTNGASSSTTGSGSATSTNGSSTTTTSDSNPAQGTTTTAAPTTTAVTGGYKKPVRPYGQ